MNTERWVYTSCLERLARGVGVEDVYDLLRDWSSKAKGQNIAEAACYYLTHFVIPKIQGGSVREGNLMPVFVDRQLFHPRPERIESVADWLSLFPGTACEALYERESDKGERGVMPILVDVEITPEVVIEAKEESRGLFFTPNGYRGNRRAENVDRINACFADFDGGDKGEQMGRIEKLPLAPSILVESGSGYHVYWILDRSYSEKNLWARIQKKIIEVCGSDKAVKNADRLMRLPFSWHTKREPHLLVTVFRYTDKTYTLSELETAFPPDPEVFYLSRNTDRPKSIREPNVGEIFKNERHGTLMEEAGKLYAGLKEEQAREAREVVKEWYQKASKPLKPYWEREADEVCDWIERKQFGKTSR